MPAVIMFIACGSGGGGDSTTIPGGTTDGSASTLKNSRVVFNICGNKYRLIVKVRYGRDKIYIRFIGTHKEYNSIDADNV